MALTAGTRLGHYDVTALLGEGGMGQVWQATDTQLNRQVALKVLPPDTAADPERLDRFQREAQVIAALNHPNVVTIYSVEEADATHFLTMELVEGKTLVEVIPRYCQMLWIGHQRDQAATFRSPSLFRSCCTPSMNVTPARTSGSRCAPLSRRQRCCAISSSL